ncbi:MAG: energy-coupling factor transporter transmembrane protein EcfT [Actinomycetia bacterium]|nr:energy-coupling factor transporter transmembrane protein EcfT [Actinomycetes bacterium]
MIPVYREKDSFLQKMHPATQLTLAFSLLILSLVAENPLYQVAIIAATAILAASANVFREWWSWWKICLVIGLAALIINPLVSREGVTVIWRGPIVPVLGRLDITLEAVAYGAGMALRLAAVIWVFALLSLVMDPDRALGLLRGKGSRSALASALALRMVPTAMRDSVDILDAQRARGVARDDGGKLLVLRSRLPLVKRLVSTGLDRGIGLAESMESRAYGSHRRTRLTEFRFGAGDVVVILLSAALLTTVVAGIVGGAAPFTYYPSLSSPASGWTVAFAALPVVAALIILILSESWKRWIWLKLRI